MSQWIKCKDRLPDEDVQVLLGRVGSDEITNGEIHNGKWWYREWDSIETIPVAWSDTGFVLEYFTHWMPMPEPPIDDEVK